MLVLFRCPQDGSEIGSKRSEQSSRTKDTLLESKARPRSLEYGKLIEVA